MMVGLRVWRLELGFFLGWFEGLEVGVGILSWLVVVGPLCYSVDILLFSLRLVGSFWIVVQLVSRL